MANKSLRTTIWQLDSELTLESVKELLLLNYNKIIDYLENHNLDPIDKVLINRWETSFGNRDFEIKEVSIKGYKVRCINTIACFETAASPNSAIIGEFILPRERRVFSYAYPVYFFELGSRVYVIVVAPASADSRIRSALMGGARKPVPEHTKWKKVQFSDIPNYTFNSDFFYWFISKQNQVINSDLSQIQVRDIKHLSQVTERKDTKHLSEGDNLLDEAVPKTGLGVNSNVGQVGTTLVVPEAHLRLILMETGECYIDPYLSSVNGPNGQLEPVEDNLESVALMLYVVLLPTLKAAYNADIQKGSWAPEHHAQARKEWALGAINELCSENGITLEEIKSLEWFN